MSYEMYLENEVMTANQGKLLIMLYDGAIKFLRRLDNIDYAKECETKTYNINKAYSILSELQITLNMEYKDIAGPLFALYDYMQGRLLEANLHNKKEHVQEVITLLSDLRTTWCQVIVIDNNNTAQNSAHVQTTEHLESEEREAFSIAC